MSDNISIENYEVVNNLLLVTFTDRTEAVINLERLRQSCPCASCEGEKDALGNIYKGPKQQLNEKSFLISGVQPVGYYGLRPFWRDGHNTGIYTTKILKQISD